MTAARVPAVWFLTRHWLRSRVVIRSVAVLAPSCALLIVAYICISAFVMTPQQTADSVLGESGAETSFGVNAGQVSSGFLTSASRVLSAQVPGSYLYVESDQLRPDFLTPLYVQAVIDTLPYYEGPDLRQAFPGRFSLLSGSWPTRPDDVVVSSHLWDELPDRHSFTVLSGRVTMRVVGVFKDVYSTDSDRYVGGPGTFSAIVRPAPGQSFGPTSASVNLLLPSKDSVPAAARALTSLYPSKREARHQLANLDPNTVSRNYFLNQPSTGFGSGRYGVTYLPMAVVLLVAAALAIGASRRRLGEDAVQLAAVGVPRRLTLLTQAFALMCTAAIAMTAGVVLGWLIAEVLRSGVLPALAHQPLSPTPGLSPSLWRLLLGAWVVVIVGSVTPTLSMTWGWRRAARWIRYVHPAPLRWLSAALLVVAASRSSTSHSTLAAYLVVGAVVILTPDAVHLALHASVHGRARSIVISRLALAESGRVGLSVIVLSCCIAAPILAGTQLVSRRASDQSYNISRIPAGQIWLSRSNGRGDLAGLAQAIKQQSDLPDPVQVRTQQPTQPKGNQAANAVFTTPQRTSGSLNLLIVPAVKDIESVLDTSLAASSTDLLDSGGVLDFSGAHGPQRLRITSTRGMTLFETPPLPTQDVVVKPAIRSQFAGAILLTTAQRLHLPISSPADYVYSHVSPAQISAAVSSATHSGYDSRFVQYRVTPPKADIPNFSYFFLAAMIVGTIAVLLVVLTAMARRLRAYTARLVAIGLTPRWNLSLLLAQAAIMIGISVLAGVTAGILGVKLVSDSYATTVIPVGPILLGTTCTVVAAGMATAFAARSLTAREYQEVN